MGYSLFHLFEPAPQHGSSALLGHRTQRFRGAFGASLLSHAAFFGLIYFLITLPASVSPLAEQSRQALAGLVFVNTGNGAAGGGGGGGNHSAEPPRRLQTRGMEAFAVPVLKAPPLTAPQQITQPQDPPPMALVVPVKPMDAGQLAMAGIVQGANAAPTLSQGSGSEGGGGTGRGPGSGPGDGPGLGPGRLGGFGGDAYQVGNGVSSPILLREIKPGYTPDAMRARIQGEVLISAVVLPDGSVTNLRVARSLDRAFGLDEQALKAVQQWRFKPGMRLGQPVAVQIDIAVGFTMR